MTERAKRIYRAWEDKWVESNKFPNHEELSLAAAIREIVNEFEFFMDDDSSFGTMVVSSQDLIDLANELEAL
jgi:hypothetical protein